MDNQKLSKSELIEELKEKYNIPKETSEEEAIEILVNIGKQIQEKEKIKKQRLCKFYNKVTFRNFVGRR